MPLLLPPASSPTPSPVILDLLAQLSPPLPPNSPPAPAFLCPSCLRPELSSARRRRRQLPTSSSSNPPVTPPEQQQPHHSTQLSHPLHSTKTSYNQHDPSLIASVPPKFVQSSDGFWYLATSWAFHGQTSQPNLLSTPTPTTSPHLPPSTLPFTSSDVVSTIQPARTSSTSEFSDDDDGDDDTADLTATMGYTTSVESLVASDYDAIKDSLPTGWTRAPERTKFYSTPVIIVVSLILAISLSLIIAACVMGHKAKSGSNRSSFKKILSEAKSRANAQKSLSRPSFSSGDPAVDTESGDPELEILSDTERTEKIIKSLKRKEKLWDKWRSKSGKLSDLGLRRRKKKTATLNTSTITRTTSVLITPSVPPAEPATPSIIDVHVAPTTPPPTTSILLNANTSTSSGQSASLSIPPVSSAVNTSDVSLQATLPSTAEDNDNLSITTPTRTNSWRHPPAYRHGATVAVEPDQKGVLSSEISQSESFEVDTEMEEDSDTHPEYSPPPPLLSSAVDLPHRGHVATDDKAVLEMMRRGASEPQQLNDAHVLASVVNMIPESSQSVLPNAPVLVDESLEDFVEDSSNRDSYVQSSSPPPSGSKLQLPPLPPPDLHRRLERHHNIGVLLPSTHLSTSTEADLTPSLRGSEPPLPDAGPSLRPSAPPEDDADDGEWVDSSFSNHRLKPSAPPLLSDLEEASTEEEDHFALHNEEEEAVHSDGRRSRWDREADLARTRSTPGTNASTTTSPRPHRRRSLSASSLDNGSSNPTKRLSLPRYEP